MVETIRQRNELLNTLAEELFESIRQTQWDAVRQLLTRVPPRKRLPLARPSIVTALLAVMFLGFDIPIDVMRDVLEVIGSEGCLERQGHENCALLHCCLLAELDIDRFEVVVAACPEAVLAVDIDGDSPIDYLCRLAPNDRHPGDTIARKVEIMLQHCPEVTTQVDSEGHNILLRAIKFGACDNVIHAILESSPGLR